MSISDTIENLFKTGVVQLNIGKSPDGEEWLAEVRQVVDTGDKGQTHLVHQIASKSVVGCIDKAKSQVEHANTVPMFLSRKN